MYDIDLKEKMRPSHQYLTRRSGELKEGLFIEDFVGFRTIPIVVSSFELRQA